jgi:hypothetical protein
MAEHKESANRRRRSDMTGPLFENTQLGKLRNANHYVQLMIWAIERAEDGEKEKLKTGVEN